MKIFIIEDYDNTMDDIKKIVKSVYPDSEVLEANKYDNALSILDNYTLDILIIDLRLSGDSPEYQFEGYEIARKAKIKNKKAKIIIMSAYFTEHDYENVCNYKVYELIDKLSPNYLADLKRKLKSLSYVEPKKTQVFFSYVRVDQDEVIKYYEELLALGLMPWMDMKNILPGQKWRYFIEEAIQRSDFFLVCLSKNSVDKRGFIQNEIKQALDIQSGMLDSDIFIIPVRLENCMVPGKLREFQWVDIFEKNGFLRLLDVLNEVK